MSDTIDGVKNWVVSAIAAGTCLTSMAGSFVVTKMQVEASARDISALQTKTQLLDQARELHSVKQQLLDQRLGYIEASLDRIERRVGSKSSFSRPDPP